MHINGSADPLERHARILARRLESNRTVAIGEAIFG
jgi:hypothetical protein